jgi:Glycosyltransferase WbsX
MGRGMTVTKIEKPGDRARLIAFYLPQFHPIPENDEWWGKGFTEWTNVAKAKPLFPGHHQPHVPADLGFYDLRLPEVRQAQADLAQEHGIGGFCYWHYWFGNGRRILERTFDEVLESGSPDFPFCLGWANESWTGIWHGSPDRTLVEQVYPGKEDETEHFYTLLKAFKDQRYIRIDDKPVFLIYKPHLISELKEFIGHWQDLARKENLKGIYFIANVLSIDWDPKSYGFDGFIIQTPGTRIDQLIHKNIFSKIFWLSIQKFFKIINKPFIFPYFLFIKDIPFLRKDMDQFPCIAPNWDNTPRCGANGYLLANPQPALFQRHLKDALEKVAGRDFEKRLLFVKSWNEWAEGNHLEPDLRFGRQYLEVCKNELLVKKKQA